MCSRWPPCPQVRLHDDSLHKLYLITKNLADNITIKYRKLDVHEVVPLRHTVLWPDQPVSYVLLPEDSEGFHFGAIYCADGEEKLGTPIAVISLFVEALPSADDGTGAIAPAARFRKFACDPTCQGRGVGTGLLRYVFGLAKHDLKCSVLWCDARVETAGWYERRGMQRFGETFYKGPVQYVRMKISI
ncbi:hypothetical protein BDW22DRAFT_881135 [Trametopsis cervina]|nr:hypothetical protein BDW22DRAFT_881135 [Trametopsis cervina]